jgi:flagellar assembly protein FliH
MQCKIADDFQTVDAIAWRSISETAGSGGQCVGAQTGNSNRLASFQKDPSKAKSTGGDSASELAELHHRLAELEQRHPAEVAHARQTGLNEGRAEAAGELQKAFDQIARTIDDLSKTKRKVRNEAEHELVKLALAIARRIMHRELSTDPDSIEGIVHAALQKLQQREVSRVRVYPAALEAVRMALDRIGTRSAIEVSADAGLESGAIIFELSVGELDASIETQLQEIQRGFADRLAIR